MQTNQTVMLDPRIPRRSDVDRSFYPVFRNSRPIVRGNINKVPRRIEFTTGYHLIAHGAGLASNSSGSQKAVNSIIERSNSSSSQKNSPSLTLSVTLERLESLLFVEEEEDFPIPSKYAYQKAARLLKDADDYLPGTFPRATVSVEENGGVFIYWIKPSCTVQLTVPSAFGKLFYIRVRKNESSALVYQDVTGEQLAKCLKTFNLMH